ncbi:MAG: penicillin-binding protein 2 [Lachnospiraceae bacterium]|nr:penicillin-binding protein 2 [Lachnospiraceae bacterium]
MKRNGFDDNETKNSIYDGDIADISNDAAETGKGRRGRGRKSEAGDAEKAEKAEKAFLTKEEAEKAVEERKKASKTVLHRQNKKQNEKQNREIMRVTYFFVLLFICVITYLVVFEIRDARELASSEKNSRVEKLNETVVKGRILAQGGEVLAQTVTDASGAEKREYPYGRLFAHVVGTTEVNRSGLESAWEYDMLQSDEDPIKKAVNEYRGIKSQGNDICTTLDVKLQMAAWDALGDQQGVVIAMDPETGRILCMVSKPDYDPNTLVNDYANIVADPESKTLLNQAVSGLFTPGSIFKIFTTVAYVRQYGYGTDYTYNCTGTVTLANSVLECYGRTAHGREDLEGSFANSCNASYATMGNMIKRSVFRETCSDMLFNRDLPTKLVHAKSSFTLADDANEWVIGVTAIGQGETVMTPLHAVMIASAIANDGVLMEPYLVEQVVGAGGNVVKTNMPVSGGQILSSTEAEYMQGLMEGAVKHGTGYGLYNLGFTVCGKTGTAEVGGRGNNDWFVGYAELNGKKIAICVLVEDASTSSTLVAVPVARKVLQAYYN